MKEITIDQKLQRKKKSAIASVIIFLVLFVGVSIFQLSWNLYRFRFAKDGLAVLVDGQLAVGVEKIYHGEEATQILQKLSKNNPKPEEGNEFVLLKIKIKNVSWWKANPRYLEFRLYTKSIDEYGDWTSDVDFYNPPTGEFKILDTSKYFKPGEVRDGIFCYEVKNGKTLSEIKIERSNLKSYFFRSNKRYQISFSAYQSAKTIILLFYFLLAYFLFIWTLYGMSKQRIKRTDGVLKSFIVTNISYLFLPMINSGTWLLFSESWIDKYMIGIILVLLFGLLISYFFTKRKYLIQFCWFKKEDKNWLIEEFTKRMNWENPYKVNVYGAVEINNVKNQDTFIFSGNNVRVKNPTSETKKVREVLLDIFSETEIDWYSFYEQLQKIQTFFIAYFVIYLLFIIFLF